MGEVNYKPIIQDMTWSYSRIKSFNDCPYRWFLKYIHPHQLIRSVFGGERPSKADIDAAYVRSEIEKADVGLLYAYLGIKRKEMFFASYGTFMHMSSWTSSAWTTSALSTRPVRCWASNA